MPARIFGQPVLTANIVASAHLLTTQIFLNRDAYTTNGLNPIWPIGLRPLVFIRASISGPQVKHRGIKFVALFELSSASRAWQSSPLLVVEDNADDRMLLDIAFKKAGTGADVTFVTDGEEAVSYLRGSERFADRVKFPFPDLLLLDLKMPNRDGFEVLEWVRRQSSHRQLPVIVYTSSLLDGDIERAFGLGANSYLVKTPTRVACYNSLARWMLIGFTITSFRIRRKPATKGFQFEAGCAPASVG